MKKKEKKKKKKTVLLSIQAFLSAPNPDDPLANDVAEMWKVNEVEAIRNAKDWTRLYAVGNWGWVYRKQEVDIKTKKKARIIVAQKIHFQHKNKKLTLCIKNALLLVSLAKDSKIIIIN